MAEDTSIVSRALGESRVVLAGGTSGVGLATAVKFAREGAPAIALIARNEARGRAARETVLNAAPKTRVEFIAADVNDPAQAERAVSQARERLGGIDVLVNSTHAGTVPKPFVSMPAEEIQTTLDRQVLGVFYMCRFVLPIMREQHGGSIINISSDAGKLATPGEAVMGGAMAAIVMFSRTLAMESKRDGIRVNVLTPALIAGTPASDAVLADEFGARLFSKAGKLAALGVCTPQDLADTIVFLASPAAARLTGQAISVNGGMSAA